MEQVHTKVAQAVTAPFIETFENENGALENINVLPESDYFNFAFDVVDVIADRTPEKLAMLHLDVNRNEQRFSFGDMKDLSNQVANYLLSLGVGEGDTIMLLMKRHWQFWPTILACHKIGAIAIPATYLLKKDDFIYRFEAANVHSIISTADGDTAEQIEAAMSEAPNLVNRILVGGEREGWHNLNDAFKNASKVYERTPNAPCGDETMIMFFTSGTTGYPKLVKHSYTYPLAHYITAKYWHNVRDGELHFTVADTGWGKALWGKLYGQWMCEAPVFTYDFDRFEPDDILPMLKRYNITSFCSPPTIYRMLIRENFSADTFSTVRHATTAGEAMNPEVLRIFKEKTGLDVYDGFGQTETTLMIGSLRGRERRVGSLGLPIPLYDICLLDEDGNELGDNENGEICIHTGEKRSCGLMQCYDSKEATEASWYDGYYHTGDMAWRDEDGYYWYMGRRDDIINSSGYRIGPVEVESVIIELPYVLECAVTGAPDPLRGTVVKAHVVLTDPSLASEELKKEIQNFVKEKTAPYKYPRMVEFRDELPKSTGGKIQRYLL